MARSRLLVVAVAAFGLALCVAGSAPAASVNVKLRTVSEPPAEVKPGGKFSVKVRTTRRGRGLRSGRLAYYLSPSRTVEAGAIRLEGRGSLKPLRSKRALTVVTQVGVPATVAPGSYFTVVCVASVTARRNERPSLPCRASARQTTVPVPPKPTTDEEKDPKRIAIFPWVTEGGFDENWEEGLGFAVLGLLGGLVMLYIFLGEFLPSMGGKAEYDAGQLELEKLRPKHIDAMAIRDRFSRGDPGVTKEQADVAASAAQDYEVSIARVERKVVRERWKLLGMGMPIYLILGGAFAVLFASNALQAFLIGFGWTGVADRLGLKRELEAKQEQRAEDVAMLRQEASAADEAKQARAAAEAKAQRLKETLGTALGEEASARQALERQLAEANQRIAELGGP